MERKRLGQSIVTGSLLILNIVLLTTNISQKREEKETADLLLGEKATEVTLVTQLKKDEALLDSLKNNNGQEIKDAYKKEDENKQTVFEEYYKLSKDLLNAQKSNNAKKVEEIRKKIDEVVQLGSSRELFLYRGSDWEMVLNKQIPNFYVNGLQADTISILDGQGKTVGIMKLGYDEKNEKFQLLEFHKTLEWLEPTDVFRPGSGEVGVLSSEEQRSNKSAEQSKSNSGGE